MVPMVCPAAKMMMPISANKLDKQADSDRSKQKGFTLLELIIVLSLMAITASLVVPNIGSNDSKIFTSQVSQATSVLNYARRIAIVRSLPGVASFEVPNLENQNFDASETRPVRANSIHWDSQDLSLTFQNNLDQIAEEIDFIEITFFPQGGSSGGILNFQMNDFTASIRIDPITGRISTRYFGEEFDE